MMIRLLFSVSLFVTSTRAVVVDVTPSTIDDALKDVSHALIHIHKGDPRDDIVEEGAKVDIHVFTCPDGHPIFQRDQSEVFVYVRGITTPLMVAIDKDILHYTFEKLKEVYVVPDKPPESKPMRLINGNASLDTLALHWCLHIDLLECYDVDDGPLQVNGVVMEEENNLWIRNQIIPPLLDIFLDTSDLTSELFITGVHMFTKQLFLFSNDEDLESKLSPYFETPRDDILHVRVGEDNPLRDTFPGFTPPGIAFVQLLMTGEITNTTYMGPVTSDALENIVAGI